MWLFTTFGFFSIVEKESGDILTIRARVRSDLERLRDRYLETMSPILENKGTDYRFRATAHRRNVADALRKVTEDIQYPNFKNEVRRELDSDRERLCHDVWDVMLAAKEPTRPAPSRNSKRCGGVVVNDRGELLLMKPKNEFDGYSWTFPKGTRKERETRDEAALREVHEETNVVANIVARIPGLFRGGTSDTIYFLMRVDGRPGEPGIEAQEVRWVATERAEELIRKTRNPAGRARDLKVLAAAVRILGQHPARDTLVRSEKARKGTSRQAPARGAGDAHRRRDLAHRSGTGSKTAGVAVHCGNHEARPVCGARSDATVPRKAFEREGVRRCPKCDEALARADRFTWQEGDVSFRKSCPECGQGGEGIPIGHADTCSKKAESW
jgi:ADP-ribose pyrophosphatase YjhB (NUDIX family)